MVVVFGALSFILTILWVLTLEYWGRLAANPDKQSRLNKIKSEFERDKLMLKKLGKNKNRTRI
jgi:hypothetical protein